MHTTGKQFLVVFSSVCFICAFSSAVGIVYFTENVFLDLETNFCYDIGLLMSVSDEASVTVPTIFVVHTQGHVLNN